MKQSGIEPGAERPPGYERLATWMMWLGAVLALLALCYRKLGDFDLPWHLASGRVVADTGALMWVDQLSFRGQPVQSAENLMDVASYLAVHWGGALGLQFLGAVIAVSAAFLLLWQSRRAGPAAALVVALASAAMADWLIVRPATLSFALLAALLLLLDVHRRHPGTRQGRIALAAVVLLHGVWSNCHGFVVLGVAVVVGYLSYRIVCRTGLLLRIAPPADGSDLGATTAAALMTVAASCLNQAGPLLLLGPFRALEDTGNIAEWAVTTPSFLVEQAPLTLAFALLVVVAVALGRDPETGARRLTLFELGLLVMAVVLARSAVRLIPVGIVLVTPLVARRLGTLVPQTRLTVLAAAFATWLVAPWFLLGSRTELGVGFEPRHFSESLIAHIRAARPVGRMYNFFAYGGWLAWRLYPDYQVLVDGRQAWVHGAPFMHRYYATQEDPRALDELASELGLTWAVTRATEGETITPALARSPDWVMTFWNETSAVYVRRGKPNEHLAQRGYKVLRHLTPLQSVLRLALEPGTHGAALAHDGALALAQDPTSSRAAFVAACGAIAVGDERGFHASLRVLSVLTPGHASLDVLQAAWQGRTKLEQSRTPR